MPQLLFSIVKTSMLSTKALIAHILHTQPHTCYWRKSLCMFLYVCFRLIPEDFIKCYSQETQTLMIGTSTFHQGLQKEAALFHILFWEMRNIDITRRALSAWNGAFQKKAAVTTPVLKFLITCLCSQGFCHRFFLSACVCVCVCACMKQRDRGKKRHREILSSILYNWMPLFFCLSSAHSDWEQRHLPQTIHCGLWQRLTEQDMCSPRWIKLQN